MKKVLTLAILQLFVILVLSKNLPSFMKVCKRSDPEINKCFIQAFDEIRPYLKKGIPELDLPPGEPLHYINASASTGSGGSVTLKGESWNQVATGLMDVEIKNINLDLDNAKCSTSLSFPHIRLQGDYKFLGKVLLFAIDTIGQYDINSTEVAVNAELIGKLYTKNGKEHIEFEKVELLLNMKKCTVYFTNLINGNEAVTDTVNKAVNENIESIVEELKPILGQVFGGISQQYFNKFFRTFSVDELFPRD